MSICQKMRMAQVRVNGASVMSLRTRSFFMGVTAASVTWLVIIYLYVSLSQETLVNPNYLSGPIQPNESLGTITKFSKKQANVVPEIQGKFDKLIHENEIDNGIFGDNNNKKYGNKKKTKDKLKYKDFHRKNDVRELDNEKVKEHINSKDGAIASQQAVQVPTKDKDTTDPAAILAELGLVKTVQDQQEREAGYRLHAFNSLISSRLSNHRPIPDTRDKRCKDVKYPANLPNATVIVCFYREEPSALLRTVHSVLDRSPANLVHEVILVDDTYNATYHRDIEKRIAGISEKVKLVQTPKREGLIRARVFGARQAHGQVLVFLDSHVEVNVGWLEPLLEPIAQDPTHVVTPIIDVINPDTFTYTASPLVRGGFNWGLHFKWDTIPADYFASKDNLIKPIKSSSFSKKLFPIEIKYLRNISSSWTGMKLEGSTVTLTYGVWLCTEQLCMGPTIKIKILDHHQ
ncbi:unnamed protein product, partial [Meganyctiphanes norvegica]